MVPSTARYGRGAAAVSDFSPLPILLIDPELASATAVETALRAAEPEATLHRVLSLHSALAALGARPFAAIVTELHLPDAFGPEVIRRIRQSTLTTPLIVWTTGVDDEPAAATVRLGALDYVRKGPTAVGRLVTSLRAAVGAAILGSIDALPDTPASACADADPIVGTTAIMRRTLALIDRAAASSIAVLLEGETGTGKELLARAIHDRSVRRAAPFLVQNCGAISDTLLESELFGHVRGAFTGADRDRAGLFVEAGRGTVLLDEIGEAPAAVQTKLLRVLQEGEVKAVGADRPTTVQARVVAATNRDLAREATSGRFRPDLYFRLAVFPITVPPLRHRIADVPLLAERFRLRAESRENRRTSGFAAASLRALATYAWPGNVRELEHEVHRLVLSGEPDGRIQPHHLAARIRNALPRPDEPLARIIERVELALLHQRLDRFGSKTATARSLGITREALYAKLRRRAVSS
jgi:DNA-binding NtrC family response regulator